MKVTRPKRCKVCRERFVPRNSFAVACSPKCSMAYVHQQAEKKARAEKRAGRVKLMTRSDWTKKAQAAFNRYIRVRDVGLPCICCGKPLSDGGLTGGGYDAGHYRSVGSAPHLRFEPDNCHAQRKQCNQWGAGRAVDYRIGLIARIGLARVEALEADQTPRKYSIVELQGIERTYKAKTKALLAAANDETREAA